MRLMATTVLATMALASAAIATPLSTTTCDAELAAVDASFVETEARLEKAGNADQAEKCAAARHHIEVMANGVDVFLRCTPDGHDKRENIGQLMVSIADFLDISNCLGVSRVRPAEDRGDRVGTAGLVWPAPAVHRSAELANCFVS